MDDFDLETAYCVKFSGLVNIMNLLESIFGAHLGGRGGMGMRQINTICRYQIRLFIFLNQQCD